MQPPPYGPAPVYGGLRPLGVGEIIDNAIQVYRKNFRALVTMTAVAVLPVSFITILVNLSTRSSRGTSSNTQLGGISFTSGTLDAHDARVAIAGGLIVTLLGFIAGRLAVGACTRGVSDAYLGNVPADARASLSLALRRLPSLLWLEILAAPAILIGFLFCIVPGVWVWTSWLVATPALLIEGARGTRALGRSYRLVRPRFWPTLGLGIVATLLTTVVSSALVIALVGVVFASHSTTSTAYIVSAGVVSAVSSLVTTPFVAAAYVILYYDLRVRSEGLDIQMVLSSLGSPATPAYPSAPGPGSWAPPSAPPPVWGAPPPPPPPPPAPPPPAWPPDRPR